MGHIIPFNLNVIAMVMLIVMGTSMVILRIRATKKPTNAKKILIPPLGMSTGFLMFLFPPTRIPWSWAVLAFLVGMIFLAIPLIITSRFHIVDGEIYLKKSRAFVFILLILLSVRIGLHSYIEQHISIMETAGLFFILAFGMLLPWRLAMYQQYRKLAKQIDSEPQKTISPLS